MTTVLREDTDVGSGAAGEMAARLTVAGKTELSDGVVLVSLESPGGDLPVWQPGAHLDLHLPRGADGASADSSVRQYSLCGSPEDRTRYQVAVLREEAGRGGSRWIHDTLEVGEQLRVGGPRNNFELIEADEYLFVAGGIGITPLLPMLRAVAAAGRSWRLLYGGRTRRSMAFVDDLLDLGGGAVEIRPQDEFGLLDLDGPLAAAAPGTAVYACGPEPLLQALESACAGRPVALHLERFSPKAVDPGAVDTSFEVELTGSGTVIQVDAGTSLLDALEQAGAPVEYSCREGTCGTCEVAVLDGVPDHRDSLLTDEERAANDVMFPCVSRCLSRRLVLDL